MKVVALAGGVGGAKLADGLARCLPPKDLTVVVNTADDFDHLGLRICPDLDTVVYTLAGVSNSKTGWGRADETWNFLDTLDELGGPTWFRLGDRDLAMHIFRTGRLQQGAPLSQVTAEACARLGVQPRVLPMADAEVRTIVLTVEGELPFQEYFVARSCEPRVEGFRFEGAADAPPAAGVAEALREASVVVMCPSNPWVSLDPILSIAGIREIVEARTVVGVSPIVGGKALKGPAAKMYSELGIRASALAVAEHFKGLLTAMVIDQQDEADAISIGKLGIRVHVTDTVMRTGKDRARLASTVLDFAAELAEVGLEP